MATISQFDPPAGLTDFDGIPEQRAAWDDYIGQSFNDNITEAVEPEVGKGKSQYYNPKTTSTDAPFAEAVIRWKGFPLVIVAKHPGNRRAAWQEAEQLNPNNTRPQDEYLEWRVEKSAGKVTRVTFTCEGPEYWEALAHGYPAGVTAPKTSAKGDRQRLLALYRQLVGPQVQLEDLFKGGRYDRANKWNTTDGIVHLTHRANTLGAEINIAALATVIRKNPQGQTITDAKGLIECSKYGTAARASDPHIGDEVNKLAREGYAITLKNPVGLYIDSLDTTGWSTPNGKSAAQFWKPLRGAPGMTVRAVYEVPASEGYSVGDIRIGGVPIEFGGQIAERITVKLTGVACRKGSFQNPPRACPGAASVVGFVTSLFGPKPSGLLSTRR